MLSDLEPSIVLRMTFDPESIVDEEGAKVVQDLSGNENHSSVHGATFAPGVNGEAISFQGQSYVDCGNDSTLDPGSAFSISLWGTP